MTAMNFTNMNAFENFLRRAKPRLIATCILSEGGRVAEVTPHISEVDRGWDEVIDEGYDPDHSPLGCPVYWRIVKRAGEQFYCSTFPVQRDGIIKLWDKPGLSYCDPVTGIAVARIETFSETNASKRLS